MTEAKLQVEFSKWLRERGRFWLATVGHTAALYELKCVSGYTLAFSKIEEHQVLCLAKAAGLVEDVMSYKISDSAVGFKPTDGFVMSGCGGFLVVGFNEGKDVVAVDIKFLLPLFTRWLERGSRGSLSFDVAVENGLVLREGGKWI